MSLFLKTRGLWLSLALLAGCTSPRPVVDAGELPVPEEYEGEAGGNPPDFVGDLFDAGNNTPIDAGEALIDTRCCNLGFRIGQGDEPSDAIGTLVGEAQPLAAGIPLSRVDGGYVASACFPMMSSSYYVYRFEFLSSAPDSGGVSQGDGGYWVTVKRHNPVERNFAIGDERQNFIPSVMNCAELDGGL